MATFQLSCTIIHFLLLKNENGSLKNVALEADVPNQHGINFETWASKVIHSISMPKTITEW
jgi:hypothetical protein